MKSIVFVLIAMMCYAVANVILEQKFSKYNNLTLMICYCGVVWVSAFAMRCLTKTDDPSFNFPMGKELILVIVMGLFFAFADYFYVGAYTNGGNLFTIVCISVMFPVFASLMKFGWTWKLPNIWQAMGYVLAAMAVILVAKGNTVK